MRRSAVAPLLMAALLAGCGQPRNELRLVTPRLAIDREIAEQFAALLDEQSSVEVRLVPSHDINMTALDVLEAGHADIALASNNEDYRRAIATVLPLYSNVLHILYRKELEIDDARSLAGVSSVFAGPPGSPSRVMIERIAPREGFDASEINFVTGAVTCADVYVVFAPIMDDFEERFGEFDCGKYELMKLADPDDLGKGARVESAALLNPSVRPFVIPTETYGRELTPEPVVTLAVDKLLVARDDVPEPVIYDLASEVIRLKPALAAIRPALFARLTDNFDLTGSTFVIHRGARAFIERDEPSVYERYSGIAEVAVTLMIGLLSGSFAVVRIYKIRRKNRIDTFYSDAMSIRDRAQASADMNAREAAVADLRELQNSAFRLLVDEKLAADESFRIFITLSNDIADELSQPPAA